ncbi:MAG TPA: ROK family protein [Thiolapillus brandeum]|uniref:ROK family protein n=1 Tax=Thiolapillus brandeum TaxID=1076588 RepID=A0A7C5N928_9GAMM|nr:ROK family protein [Thiolapillus brandeum]
MLAGIDLGGTKIEGVLLDEAGTIRFRRRVATPAGDYEATLDAIVALHRELETAAGRELPLGLGTPGSPSPATGLMRNANSTCLNGRPLHHDLERRLQRPLRMANDADCFTLSEAVDGAGAGAAVVFGVIIGTGTGGGVAVNGRLLPGVNAVTGEWGHNPLPWPGADELPGPACYCGRRGCIETFLSGPGMAHDHERRTGETLTAREIAARAEGGDRKAIATLERYEERLARGLASIINVLDPGVIVLGGGLSHMDRLYEKVPERWGEYIFSDTVATRLLPPAHGDSSGVRGAAWLWKNQA